MEERTCIQILKDPQQIPGDELFREILSEQLHGAYVEMLKIFSDLGFTPEWRYYNDGKAWLWKISFKKNTVVWISLWEGYFMSSFYFTEKKRDAAENLEIDSKIKAAFLAAKPIGKLIPLTLDISNTTVLNDFKKIIDFKISK
jgi:hypothetical protein